MGLKIRYNQCYKPHCRCMKGGPRHGPFLYEQRSEKGKKKHYYLLAPGRVKPKATCPVCGNEFYQNKPWHTFCSRSCKQKARYRTRKLVSEHLGDQAQDNKKEVKEKMKKQKQGTQELAAQPAAPTPTPPAQPAPTLAAALLAIVEQWRQEHRLSHQEFEDALAEVWQRWQ